MVVLAVSVAQEQLQICHGVGARYHILSINDIAKSLGTDKCKTLSFFHALTWCETRCDTVPSFHSKGKKSFSQARTDHDEMTSWLKGIVTTKDVI